MADVEIRAKPDLEKVEPLDISLEPGEVGAILELTVTGPDGKVKSFRRMKSHSFVANFMRIMYVAFTKTFLIR